jgi:hypothetical protein
MFLTELSPFVRELSQQPLAFMGGFVSGLLRLNLADDPVKSWLAKQGVSSNSITVSNHNGKSNEPQSISID